MKIKIGNTIYDTDKRQDAAFVLGFLKRRGADLGTYGKNKDGVDGYWGAISQKAFDTYSQQQKEKINPQKPVTLKTQKPSFTTRLALALGAGTYSENQILIEGYTNKNGTSLINKKNTSSLPTLETPKPITNIKPKTYYVDKVPDTSDTTHEMTLGARLASSVKAKQFLLWQWLTDNADYVSNSPEEINKHVANNQEFQMLRQREAKKSKPNRWGYINQNQGYFIVCYGGNPVFMTRVVTGANLGDGGISTAYHGNYAYLKKSKSLTTPAGILVVDLVWPNSAYGTQNYNSTKRAERGNGEPVYRLRFAGSDQLLANALHASPSAKAAEESKKTNVITGSAGCVRNIDGSLRFIHDNNLLGTNDTIFSSASMPTNHLYNDENNKILLHLGDTNTGKAEYSVYQPKY